MLPSWLSGLMVESLLQVIFSIAWPSTDLKPFHARAGVGLQKSCFSQMHFEHSDDVEASSKFEQTLKDELRRVRDWLLGHDVELFQSFVESGLVLDLT